MQNVAISRKRTVQIVSAVPVFGKDETYVVLLVEHNGDAWGDRPYGWAQDFDIRHVLC